MREILPTVTPALICLSYRRGVIHADETHSDRQGPGGCCAERPNLPYGGAGGWCV